MSEEVLLDSSEYSASSSAERWKDTNVFPWGSIIDFWQATYCVFNKKGNYISTLSVDLMQKIKSIILIKIDILFIILLYMFLLYVIDI